MTRTVVVETPIYQAQVVTILSEHQRKAVQTLLSLDPFAGDEVQAGNFNLLELLWDEEREVKISYLVEIDGIYLLAITEGNVQLISNTTQGTTSFLKKFSFGVSTRLVTEALLQVLKDAGGWFN